MEGYGAAEWVGRVKRPHPLGRAGYSPSIAGSLATEAELARDGQARQPTGQVSAQGLGAWARDNAEAEIKVARLPYRDLYVGFGLTICVSAARA